MEGIDYVFASACLTKSFFTVSVTALKLSTAITAAIGSSYSHQPLKLNIMGKLIRNSSEVFSIVLRTENLNGT